MGKFIVDHLLTTYSGAYSVLDYMHILPLPRSAHRGDMANEHPKTFRAVVCPGILEGLKDPSIKITLRLRTKSNRPEP